MGLSCLISEGKILNENSHILGQNETIEPNLH